MGSNYGADELKKLMKLTEKTIKNNERTQASPRVHAALIPSSNKPVTIIMVRDFPQVPRVPPTEVLRVDETTRIEPQEFQPNNQKLAKHKSRRRRHAQTRSMVRNNSPARNTRSHTKTRAKASSRGRPNTRSSKCMYQLTHATPAKRNKTTRSENAAAVEH